MNSDTRVAREFHDRTRHSYSSVRSSGHYLDWDTKPFLFKIYPDLPSIALPKAFTRCRSTRSWRSSRARREARAR